MFQKRAVLLLSAQWRPHSEQLKLWIIGSASDVTTLSLARDYVSNLDMGSVLQTFEDGLELTSILPAIKYPLGTHTISKLSAHLEASAGEVSAKELRQLASNISLSPENLEYYDAALSTPGVVAAIRCCLQLADNSELVAFARPFWRGCERALQVSRGLSSQVTQIAADELAFRLSTSNNKEIFFDLTLMESLPLEQKEMEGLVKQLQSATEELKEADLVGLLERIAAPRNSQRYAAWGAAVQKALIEKALSDLGVRDAVAFQRVLEELKRKTPRTQDVVVAAKAARNLRLTPLLEQSELIESLGHIANVSSDDILALLSCSTAKQRESFLLFPDVVAALNRISLADSTTSDLVLLFTFLPSQGSKRAEVVAELQAREPIERGALSADDVIAAFESVASSQDMESLGRVLIRAAQNCEESHLMRLLRCASRHSKVPKGFFRIAGKPIISAANEKRLSLVNATAWLNFYVDNQIRDDSPIAEERGFTESA
ncbi:hypothetical protein CGC21_25720 [Leishmania donovani]|uniref:Uncharacterized protein n=1 Tax=Leishmania donovani TaxID=5661 RepID=A0A504X1J6_LEIDO|nr:hypothetical protein CGC21_25720 [Leishmania donovani]